MNIFQILNADEFYNESELIEIAKGKYQTIDTIKKLTNKLKRSYKWQKR